MNFSKFKIIHHVVVFCTCLLEGASIFQTELLEPALKGTLNVLKSCAKSPSVRRVVLTSSIAAVVVNGKPRTPDVVVDETWFSDPNFCRETEVRALPFFFMVFSRLRNGLEGWWIDVCFDLLFTSVVSQEVT